MDDLTPVKGPPTPFEGRSAKVMALVIIFLLVAIIKPWGDGSQGVAPPVTASATASQAPVAEVPSPTASHDPWANYNPEIFGLYEPEPRWELWPAGYLVLVRVRDPHREHAGGRARLASAPVASGSPVPSAGPVATPPPSASPSRSSHSRPVRPRTADRSGRRRSGSPTATTSGSSGSTRRSATG